MARHYKEIFDNLLSEMKAKKFVGTEKVEKAFLLAERLHKGQVRKSGEEYILHPVEVAEILEQHDFDSNVISAALLHDIVEDCGYTVKQIEEEFNPEIAKIVDAVSAIELENFGELAKNDEFKKFQLTELSYQKLINLGKTSKYAFYIKFADRLNNLRTIGCFPRYKQIEKVRETIRWILPILKMFKAYKFYNEISNECYCITNRENLTNFNKIYNDYFDFNKNIYAELKENILIALNNYLLKNKLPTKHTKVKMRNATQLETFNLINDLFDIKELKNIKQSQFNKVPITKIYIIFNNKIPTKKAKEILFYLVENNLKNDLKIINYQKNDIFDFNYLVVQDKFQNKYQLKAFNFADYVTFRNGTTDGTDIDLVDEASSEIITNYIRVKTRSGETISLPDGSTVLDFAFKIHKDFGFSVKYAYLNNSPSKSPIYTRLADGDTINLEIAKTDDGLVKYIAELRWITYAKTYNAQKALIRYFEKLLYN